MSRPTKPISLARRIIHPPSRASSSTPTQLHTSTSTPISASAWTGDEMYQSGIKDDSGRIKEYSSEDDFCPLCKTDRHTNPRLRLLISPCFHKLCESCIDKLFTISAETCPHEGCNRVIRKSNFIHQTFESLDVEREVGVRKRIGAIYNKTRKDFPSDREYDDYLEEIEDITFNLINGIDQSATESRISTYINLNASLTLERAREAQLETENLHAMEEYEAVERRARLEEAMKEEEEELKDHEEENKEIMKALEEAVKKFGTNVDSEKVVREIRERRKREKEEMEKKAEIQVQIVRKRRMPARKGGLDEEQVMEYTAHVPTSPSYEGPYVPLPYSQPRGVLGDVTGSIITTTNGYVDVDPMAKSIKADGEGKYRAGGFFLEDVWKREIGLALDSLCIDAPS